ncbi:guanine deaminase [Rhodopirellula maiorica SM1]|uniref:Guanine deaminase n=1 Tax=Rhodopirellula maiorica SM1 TaxID=1265738 RepID=M5RB27_9BACT|nr:nucleoside deaminase [Rhodopirellula maiorica]EMI16256.1 guanine deaminase [Rhodopirellula maiorica SM1]
MIELTEDLLNHWMSAVLAKGWEGVRAGQSPFAAAVYTRQGEPISCEFNHVRRTSHPSRHAEVCAIDRACELLQRTTLRDCVLISSAEPCPMCAATAGMTRIPWIVFGAPASVIEQAGYGTLGIDCHAFFAAAKPNAVIRGGILADQCSQLLLQNPKQ